MDTTATLYWAPVVLNGTFGMDARIENVFLVHSGPNIPEDNCLGHCSVGTVIRLPGCCFGQDQLFM